jgi:hypothetical protein
LVYGEQGCKRYFEIIPAISIPLLGIFSIADTVTGTSFSGASRPAALTADSFCVSNVSEALRASQVPGPVTLSCPSEHLPIQSQKESGTVPSVSTKVSKAKKVLNQATRKQFKKEKKEKNAAQEQKLKNLQREEEEAEKKNRSNTIYIVKLKTGMIL